MELNTLRRPQGLARSRRIGRGSKRGKTSGRGGKGQTARAGNKRRPQWRDIIKKIPKRRGYGKNRARTVVPGGRSVAVNLDDLSRLFKAADIVNPRTLEAKKLIRRVSGKLPPVKILGTGEISMKLSFEEVTMSKSARAAVEKAGGTIEERTA